MIATKMMIWYRFLVTVHVHVVNLMAGHIQSASLGLPRGVLSDYKLNLGSAYIEILLKNAWYMKTCPLHPPQIFNYRAGSILLIN